MPKDRTENIDRYKIRGGQLNEFELGQNEGALAEEERQREGEQHGESLLRGRSEPGLPQNVAERIRRVTEAARKKVERRGGKRAAQNKSPEPAAGEGGAENATKKATKKAAKKTVRNRS